MDKLERDFKAIELILEFAADDMDSDEFDADAFEEMCESVSPLSDMTIHRVQWLLRIMRDGELIMGGLCASREDLWLADRIMPTLKGLEWLQVRKNNV